MEDKAENDEKYERSEKREKAEGRRWRCLTAAWLGRCGSSERGLLGPSRAEQGSPGTITFGAEKGDCPHVRPRASDRYGAGVVPSGGAKAAQVLGSRTAPSTWRTASATMSAAVKTMPWLAFSATMSCPPAPPTPAWPPAPARLGRGHRWIETCGNQIVAHAGRVGESTSSPMRSLPRPPLLRLHVRPRGPGPDRPHPRPPVPGRPYRPGPRPRQDLLRRHETPPQPRAALVHRPRLLLLDEPTVGVDPQSRNHIFEEVRRLNAEGMTIVYTSHYMEEVQAL